MRILRLFGAVVFVGIASASLGACSSSGAAALPGPATACSWGLFQLHESIPGAPATLNVLFPDSNATYWVQRLSLSPGDSMTIDGSFTGSRYFSLSTYNADGTPYASLYDARIAPLSGVNVFQSTAPPPSPPTGAYRVTVMPAASGHAGSNVLPAPVVPGATRSTLTGWLTYRVYAPYAPTPPSALAGVELPALAIHFADGTSAALAPCTQYASDQDFNAILQTAAQLLAQLLPPAQTNPLFGYFPGDKLFPNMDNKYLWATTAWAPGRLIVVTGAAATFPDTPVQAIVQNPPAQLRYWSMCTTKAQGDAPIVACADDAQTQLTSAKKYVYVISATADKPSPLPAGATWLPWFAPADEPPAPGSQAPAALLFRNMIPDPSFAQSVQQVALAPNPLLPATAKAVMGPYYPSAVYCDTSVFAAAYAASGGDVNQIVTACFSAAGVTPP